MQCVLQVTHSWFSGVQLKPCFCFLVHVLFLGSFIFVTSYTTNQRLRNWSRFAKEGYSMGSDCGSVSACDHQSHGSHSHLSRVLNRMTLIFCWLTCLLGISHYHTSTCSLANHCCCYCCTIKVIISFVRSLAPTHFIVRPCSNQTLLRRTHVWIPTYVILQSQSQSQS
jgi:hypothetical protein